MSKALQYFTLNNGNKIPGISIFGTGTRWFKTEDAQFNQDLVDQTSLVLDLPGVVHIDAAEVYRTYPELAAALQKSTKPRDQLWLTDKYSYLAESPREALETSLKVLGLEYVDLYLIHNPFQGDYLKHWKVMEELYKEGKAKNIGVSNFRVEDLEKLLAIAEIKPQVNQIEYNAFLQNQSPGIYDYAKEHNILLEAYSPLGPLVAVKNKTGEFYDYIKELSSKYGKSDSSILLRWVTQTGVLPVTTSSKQERILEVTEIFEFELEDSEVQMISKLGAGHPHVRQYFGKQFDV